MSGSDQVSPRQFGMQPFSERHAQDVDRHMVRANFEVRDIDLHEQPFRATQAKVSKSTVRDYTDPTHPQAHKDRWGEVPEVIDHRGTRVVWNGHHRIAAALARGDQTMRVKYQRTLP